MTAKPKPRKAAPKAQASRPNNYTEIDKLLARYRFLEADRKQKAADAATVEESNEAWSAHDKELDRIRDRLASIVPETFSNAHDLLQFALEEVSTLSSLSDDEMELRIVENVAAGLTGIRDNFAEAVRNAAYDLILARMEAVSKHAKSLKPFAYEDALHMSTFKFPL